MRHEDKKLKDLLPLAKRIPSYKVKSHDKRIVGDMSIRSFNRLGLSPSQPHSKTYGR